MKTLTILRHAKSSWAEPGVADFDRPLNARGRRAASAVGEALKKQLTRLDAVLASPAARVRETLDRVQTTFGPFPDIRFEQELYLADPDTILRLVREFGDDIRSALVVGHNPGLHELVLALCRPGEDLRAELADNLPTGAAVVLELPATQWRDVAPGTAAIAALILPLDLA